MVQFKVSHCQISSHSPTYLGSKALIENNGKGLNADVWDYIFYYKQFQLRAYMHLTDDWVLSSIGKKFPKCMKVATKNDPQLFPCWLFKWDVFQIMTIAVSW